MQNNKNNIGQSMSLSEDLTDLADELSGVVAVEVYKNVSEDGFVKKNKGWYWWDIHHRRFATKYCLSNKSICIS